MIISIMNLKGGIGKTTTAVNLGYLAAEKEKMRTLIIDNDPQGNATSFFEVQNNGKSLPDMINELLINGQSIAPIIPAHTQYKRIDILPGNMNLSTCNIELSKKQPTAQFELYKDLLDNIIQKYDLVLIDNAPNITPLTVSALLASKKVIVPVESDQLSIDGANEIVKQITEANRAGYDLELGGILFTKFNSRIRVDKETLAAVKNGQLTGGIKNKVYDTAIRHTVKVREATYYHKPLELVCKNSNAACDYRKLAKEIFK